MSDDVYLTPVEAAKLLRVFTQTLINWNNAGFISSIRTQGGHRRFLRSQLLGRFRSTTDTRACICYCRVSTSGQKEDLERQSEFFRLRYPNHEIIKDIGSGLNFKRKGLNSILERAIRGDIREVVVTHKDRLCRFGFELIERIIRSTDGTIVVLDKQETSPQKELVDDLLSIITVFSSRVYGLRSHALKNKIKECQSTISSEDPENAPISN